MTSYKIIHPIFLSLHDEFVQIINILYKEGHFLPPQREGIIILFPVKTENIMTNKSTGYPSLF